MAKHISEGFHILTVGQLDDLPSSVVYQLSRVMGVLHIAVNLRRPGETIDCRMWGQPVSMTYEVARHLAVLHKLEK
jgi:hypothetical protein